MSIKADISRSISRNISRSIIQNQSSTDPDFLAYRTLASSLVSEPFDLTATNPAFTTAVVEDIQNSRFIGYKGTVPSRWSNAAVYGTAPTPVDVWNNNLTEVYGLSLVKFAGLRAKLKYDSVSTLTNNNFVAGDYDPLSGLTGDGNSKYLGASYSGNADNTQGIGVYLTSLGASAGTRTHIGCFTSADGTSSRITFTKTGSTTFVAPIGPTVSSTFTRDTGFWSVSTRSTTDHEVYKNGSSVLSFSTSSPITTQGSLSLFKPGDFAGEYSDSTIAFAYHGSTGLTDAAAEWLAWVESCVAVDGGYNTFDPTVRWP